jgi:hypothetical protein
MNLDQTPTDAKPETSPGEPCADIAPDEASARVALVAFYADPDAAHRHLDLLLRRDAPMDRISVLGRADASGDDPLGLYHPGAGDRMRGWGQLGALWGGIFGLLGGASGLFLLPGLGTVAVAGPLVAALTAGVAGAGAGGVLMAGAGAGAHLAAAIHRLGIPADCVSDMQKRLAEGETLLMLILDHAEAVRWRPLLEMAIPAGTPADEDTEEAPQAPGPIALWELPYTGLTEGARELA